MARLVAGLAELGIEPDHRPAVNMVFLRVEPATIDAWAEAGLDFYRMAKDRVRFVTSFRSTPEPDRRGAAADAHRLSHRALRLASYVAINYRAPRRRRCHR